MTSPIAAVVLAAGFSSRTAPVNKLLAPMAGGDALIVHTVRQVLASKASPVIVVTGFQAALVESALAGLQVCLVRAPDFAAGMAASLRAGVAALPLEVEAVAVVLGDMPLVQSAVIGNLLAAYDPETDRDIVVPIWHGRRGNPRILGRRYFGALQSLTEDAGANDLIETYSERVIEVDVADDTVCRDFDTREALDALLEEPD